MTTLCMATADAANIPAGIPIAAGTRRVIAYTDGPYNPAQVNNLEIGVASA